MAAIVLIPPNTMAALTSYYNRGLFGIFKNLDFVIELFAELAIVINQLIAVIALHQTILYGIIASRCYKTVIYGYAKKRADSFYPIVYPLSIFIVTKQFYFYGSPFNTLKHYCATAY